MQLFDVAVKRRREEDEVQMINAHKPKCCPHCNNLRISRFGQTKNGLQRYLCDFCRKTFTPVTGTAFENSRLPLGEWLQYAATMAHSELLGEETRMMLHEEVPDWRKLLFRAAAIHKKSIVFSGLLELWSVSCLWRPQTKAETDGQKEGWRAFITIGVGRSAGRTCNVFYYDGEEAPKPETILANFKENIKEKTVLLHRNQDTGLYKMLVNALELKAMPVDAEDTSPSNSAVNVIIPEVQEELLSFLNSHKKWLYQGIQGYLDLFGFCLNTNADKFCQIEILRDIVLEMRRE